MQYVLCPRCKFKVPLNKHLCSTCGFVMPAAHNPEDVTSEGSTVVIGPKPGFWATLFGLQPPAPEENNEQDTKAAY